MREHGAIDTAASLAPAARDFRCFAAILGFAQLSSKPNALLLRIANRQPDARTRGAGNGKRCAQHNESSRQGCLHPPSLVVSRRETTNPR